MNSWDLKYIFFKEFQRKRKIKLYLGRIRIFSSSKFPFFRRLHWGWFTEIYPILGFSILTKSFLLIIRFEISFSGPPRSSFILKHWALLRILNNGFHTVQCFKMSDEWSFHLNHYTFGLFELIRSLFIQWTIRDSFARTWENGISSFFVHRKLELVR